jgi:hypothetical protein
MGLSKAHVFILQRKSCSFCNLSLCFVYKHVTVATTEKYTMWKGTRNTWLRAAENSSSWTMHKYTLKQTKNVGFEVFAVMTIKMLSSGTRRRVSLVKINVLEERPSKMSVFTRPTRCHVPEDDILQTNNA